MKMYRSEYHPSFGFLTAQEVSDLFAMKDGDTYREERKRLEHEASLAAARAKRRAKKKEQEISFPPVGG